MDQYSERKKELLNKYYKIDDENNSASITLKYDSLNDLLDNNLVTEEEYDFNEDILVNVYNHVSKIPVKYKIDINFIVDDFCDLDCEKVIHSFDDGLELNHYFIERHNKRKRITTAMLIVTGVVILLFMICAKNFSLFGDTMASDVLIEVTDIAAWVFIWEAVSITFLSKSDMPYNGNRLKVRIKNVSIKNSKTDEVITKDLTTNEFSWPHRNMYNSILRNSLLIIGSVFLAIGTCNFIWLIPDYNALADEINLFIFDALARTIIGLLEIFLGIIAIISYASNDRFSKSYKIISILLIIVITIYFITTILFQDYTYIFNAVVTYIFIAIYIFSMAQLIIRERKEVKNKKKYQDNLE